MTPKEKASELVEKFYQLGKNHDLDYSKDSALIAVEYLIAEESHNYYYWIDVKKEIEKL
jgi:hypothetical protein